MLTSIEFTIPQTTAKQRAFNVTLFELLDLPNFGRAIEDPTILQSKSTRLFPKLKLIPSEETTLSVAFCDNENVISHLEFMHQEKTKNPKPRHAPALLSLDEFVRTFKDSIIGLNHIGINFFTSLMDQPTYRRFKSTIADETNLYSYPTGEEWPFIIPATPNEHASDISDFSIRRNPEFEFVYSRYEPIPCIQFDLEAALTKDEVFQRLPRPHGISFNGLEDYIRTAYIAHPWGNGLLRFDVRFKASGPEIYPWLVQEGGRVRSHSSESQVL